MGVLECALCTRFLEYANFLGDRESHPFAVFRFAYSSFMLQLQNECEMNLASFCYSLENLLYRGRNNEN